MPAVPTPPATPIPTLSAVEGWSTEYLSAAAGHWTSTAATWEDAFTEVANETGSPQVQWDGGVAAAAAQLRTYRDRLKVIGSADELHSAAAAARAGAEELSATKQRAVAAISQARSAGFFDVAEDLSVSYRGRVTATNAASLQTQAQTLAASIRTKAMELSAVDQVRRGEGAPAVRGDDRRVRPPVDGRIRRRYNQFVITVVALLTREVWLDLFCDSSALRGQVQPCVPRPDGVLVESVDVDLADAIQ